MFAPTCENEMPLESRLTTEKMFAPTCENVALDTGMQQMRMCVHECKCEKRVQTTKTHVNHEAACKLRSPCCTLASRISSSVKTDVQLLLVGKIGVGGVAFRKAKIFDNVCE